MKRSTRLSIIVMALAVLMPFVGFAISAPPWKKKPKGVLYLLPDRPVRLANTFTVREQWEMRCICGLPELDSDAVCIKVMVAADKVEPVYHYVPLSILDEYGPDNLTVEVRDDDKRLSLTVKNNVQLFPVSDALPQLRLAQPVGTPSRPLRPRDPEINKLVSFLKEEGVQEIDSDEE